MRTGPGSGAEVAGWPRRRRRRSTSRNRRQTICGVVVDRGAELAPSSRGARPATPRSSGHPRLRQRAKSHGTSAKRTTSTPVTSTTPTSTSWSSTRASRSPTCSSSSPSSAYSAQPAGGGGLHAGEHEGVQGRRAVSPGVPRARARSSPIRGHILPRLGERRAVVVAIRRPRSDQLPGVAGGGEQPFVAGGRVRVQHRVGQLDHVGVAVAGRAGEDLRRGCGGRGRRA